MRKIGNSQKYSLKAATVPSSLGLAKTAGSDITRSAPMFYDPRYSHTTLAIPTDERTLNGLYRFYADTDPIVGNAIHLHTTFPLSRVELTNCGDPAIQQHFEEMWHDRIQGMRLLTDIGSEYWTLGNVFPYGAWNDEDAMWEHFAILNPDYVQVDATWVAQRPLIKLQIEDGLKRIVNTGSPRALYEQLSPDIIRYVRLNQPIPLHPNNVFHLAHNKSPYERLGKPIIKRILKTLMYEDRLQNAQYAIAHRHIVPLTVVKLGDPQSGYLPEPAELDEWRQLLAAHELDPNFSIVYHYGVDVQYYGANGKILQTNYEFDRITKLKFIGLGISEALITGQGTYANAYASLAVARQRYLHFQLTIKRFVDQGILKTVADAAGFYRTNKPVVGAYLTASTRKYGEPRSLPDPVLPDLRDQQDFVEAATEIVARQAEKSKWERDQELVMPELSLDLMSLNDDQQYRTFLMSFEKHFAPKDGRRRVSNATYYRLARIDPAAEQRQLDQEELEDYKQRLRKAWRDQKFQEFLTRVGLSKEKASGGVAKPVELGETEDELSPPSEEAEGLEQPSAPIGEDVFEGEAPATPELSALEEELSAGLASEEAELAQANANMLKQFGGRR